MVSTGQKISCPLVGIFLKNWIQKKFNFNNAFHKHEERSRIRAQSEWRYFLKIEFPLIPTGKKESF